MATEEQLIEGLRRADAAGNTEDAQAFANAIKSMRAASPTPQPEGGLARNFAAGTVEGATGGLAALSDPGAGDELGALGLSPHVPMGTPAQGAHALNVGLGQVGLNPEMVSANSDLERLLRTGGQLVPAAFGGEGGIVNRVARVAVPTATSTGARLAAKGTPYEEPAAALGALAGGGLTALGETAAASGSAVANKLFRGAAPSEAAQAAHEAGYVLPPNMASEKPGAISALLNSAGGKIKTQQKASIKNQPISNNLAAQDVGLPPDGHITPDALEEVRANAGNAYATVRKAPIDVILGDKFKQSVADLHEAGQAARTEAPELVQNPEIDQLSAALLSKEKLSPAATVDLVRSLRYKAQTNLKNYASPEKMDLGRAQSKAATALEGALEDNLQAATTARAPIGAQGGDMTAMLGDLQNARQTIAKTYDIEKALTPAGNVNAQRMAAIGQKRPLSGNLQKIADMGANFPKASQPAERIGGDEKLSIVDLLLAAGTHAKTLGLSLARPGVRAGVLSSPYQKLLMGTAEGGPTTAASGVPSISAVTLARLLQSRGDEAR